MENKQLMKIMEEARSLLADEPLQNTQRILILVALYLSKRLTFTELSRITGIDKGRLEYHLEVPEKTWISRKETAYNPFLAQESLLR